MGVRKYSTTPTRLEMFRFMTQEKTKWCCHYPLKPRRQLPIPTAQWQWQKLLHNHTCIISGAVRWHKSYTNHTFSILLLLPLPLASEYKGRGGILTAHLGKSVVLSLCLGSVCSEGNRCVTTGSCLLLKIKILRMDTQAGRLSFNIKNLLDYCPMAFCHFDVSRGHSVILLH